MRKLVAPCENSLIGNWEWTYVFEKFFMPADRIEEATARDGIPYNAMITNGWLSPSDLNLPSKVQK